jgi:LmbE family N-acetylglucosaminyl deacetylase
VKKVFLSPHNDDETLFGAFTIMQNYQDIEVVVVYDSFVQVSRGHEASTATVRRNETLAALALMGVSGKQVTFLGMRDDDPCRHQDITPLLEPWRQYQIYAPLYEIDGNKHHNAVAYAVTRNAFDNVTRYLTYTSAGKSTSGNQVHPRHGVDVRMKFAALLCYRSQFMVPDCVPHFMRSQEEFRA